MPTYMVVNRSRKLNIFVRDFVGFFNDVRFALNKWVIYILLSNVYNAFYKSIKLLT